MSRKSCTVALFRLFLWLVRYLFVSLQRHNSASNGKINSKKTDYYKQHPKGEV